MNKLNLTLTRKLKPYSYISIDGEPIDPVYKKGSKSGSAVIETEKQEVTLSYSQVSRFDSKFWWLFEMMFFIVSIFGIFDLRFPKIEYIIKCKIKLKLNENTNVKVRHCLSKKGSPVLAVESDAEVTEEENVYEINEQVKRKKKILTISKIITTVLIIALVAVLIII